MTFSQARIDAYAQLESAIMHLQDVIASEQSEPSEDVVLGDWLLITSGMAMFQADDPDKPLDDDEMKNIIGMYSKRGSMAIVNQALAQEYLFKCQER
jgi:hypothetical protein